MKILLLQNKALYGINMQGHLYFVPFLLSAFFLVLTVSFEKSSDRVLESAGPVETCLLLNCEAAKPVDVTISAQESRPPQARGTYNRCKKSFGSKTTYYVFWDVFKKFKMPKIQYNSTDNNSINYSIDKSSVS